jgi:hypothetical protein
MRAAAFPILRPGGKNVAGRGQRERERERERLHAAGITRQPSLTGETTTYD